MVINPIIAKRSIEAKHLLRELYRHASCFFDDQTRDFLRRRIRDRFRECRVVDTPYRQSQLLKNGRKIASTLQRANAGDPERIFVILRHSYGRVGKRWHQLMKPYMDDMQKTEELVPGDRRTATPQITPQLRVLLLQHMESKKMKPKITDTNIWNKPFPIRRKVNATWKHFSKIIAKITPPLPEEETLRLERFASGQEEPIPPKRKAVVQCRDTLETNEDHNITKRFKRRIFTRLLRVCPRMIWNEERDKWAVRMSETTKVRWPVGEDPDDFAGVESDGSLPGTKVRRFHMQSRRRDKRIRHGVLVYSRFDTQDAERSLKMPLKEEAVETEDGEAGEEEPTDDLLDDPEQNGDEDDQDEESNNIDRMERLRKKLNEPHSYT